MSEFYLQKRTTKEIDFDLINLQNLKNKICSSLISKTIVVFHGYVENPKKIFNHVFKDCLKINFVNSFYALHDFLQIVQSQKRKGVTFMIQHTIGQSIEFGGHPHLLQNGVDPYQTEYENRVCDEKVPTQATDIIKKGSPILFPRKDTKMLNMVFNREKNIFKYFFGDTIFKIPSKPLEYNKELNSVGIDFGTLECCAAVIRRNGPEAVVLDPLTNKRTLPSYVSINEANQPCGQLFMNRMERNPEYSAYETKRLIGKEMEEIIVDPSWLFNVIRYRGQTNLLFHDKKNEPEMRSVIEITNYVLKQIKVKTEEFQGERLENVVITVPSNFSQEQKAATIVAANVVGWNSVHLLLEPISALIAYSHEAEIPNKSTVFVFDFGGGTKTCISKIVNNEIKILNNYEDYLLGGKDFDRFLIARFNSVLKHQYGINVLDSNKKYRLMIKCLEIKHTLSTSMDTSLDVDDFKRDETSVIPITRKEFEDMTKDLIIRGKNLIDKVLKKAKLNRNDINIAFHVGGGCRMPMIKKMLNEIFPNAEHRCSIHPEELIAKGAALYAYERKNLVLPNFDYYFSAISILIAIVLMLSIKILIIC